MKEDIMKEPKSPYDQLEIKAEMEKGRDVDNLVKTYEVTYKFSDILITVEAENKEEAEEIARVRLENDNLAQDTKCYNIEVEEVD